MCPSSGNYEIHGVEPGDLDGDQDLDIILVVCQDRQEQGTDPRCGVRQQPDVRRCLRFTENPISSVA